MSTGGFGKGQESCDLNWLLFFLSQSSHNEVAFVLVCLRGHHGVGYEGFFLECT